MSPNQPCVTKKDIELIRSGADYIRSEFETRNWKGTSSHRDYEALTALADRLEEGLEEPDHPFWHKEGLGNKCFVCGRDKMLHPGFKYQPSPSGETLNWMCNYCGGCTPQDRPTCDGCGHKKGHPVIDWSKPTPSGEEVKKLPNGHTGRSYYGYFGNPSQPLEKLQHDDHSKPNYSALSDTALDKINEIIDVINSMNNV